MERKGGEGEKGRSQKRRKQKGRKERIESASPLSVESLSLLFSCMIRLGLGLKLGPYIW